MKENKIFEVSFNQRYVELEKECFVGGLISADSLLFQADLYFGKDKGYANDFQAKQTDNGITLLMETIGGKK